jgi:hypothetical protein
LDLSPSKTPDSISDAHSGATATDFHRVPICLFDPSGPNRKASSQFVKELWLVFYPIRRQIANKITLFAWKSKISQKNPCFWHNQAKTRTGGDKVLEKPLKSA